MSENKITMGKYLGEECYIVNEDYESALYAGYVSELNITLFIYKELIDPTNGLFILSRGDRKWFPLFDKSTNRWTYARR